MNRFIVNGDVTTIFIDRKDGEVYECYISTVDLARLIKLGRSWYLTSHGYIASKPCNEEFMYLHRFLSNAEDHHIVDHIDGNPRNNVRDNLRIVDRVGNSQNRRKDRRNKSGIMGVHLHNCGKYRAQVMNRGKRVHLGYFDTAEEAGAVIREYKRKNMPTSREARGEVS